MVKCKQCGNENAKDAKTCPKCGTSLKMGMGKKVLLGVGVLVLLAAIGKAGGKGEAASQSPNATQAQGTPAAQAEEVNAPARAEPELTYTKDSCVAVATKFGTSSKLSDLQKDELWPQYKGKAFEWNLEITDVSSAMLGGYTVQAKCSPQSPSLVQDIVLSFPSEAKKGVLGLEKGKTYKMKGVLTNTSTLLGLAADAVF